MTEGLEEAPAETAAGRVPEGTEGGPHGTGGRAGPDTQQAKELVLVPRRGTPPVGLAPQP